MGGLMDYNARFYSPTLGRFLQPDTIIPDQTNPQAWNRYSYVMNSPIRYNDPTGHDVGCPGQDASNCGTPTIPSPGNGGGGGGGTGDNDNHPTQLEEDIANANGENTSAAREDYPPYIYRLSDDLIVIIMPPGSTSYAPRSNFAQRLGINLGIAGFLFDVGELVGIFIPQIGGEDAAAFSDVAVTYASSAFSGQSYVFEQPHPDVPRMLSVNQDVLVTAGDAIGALAAKGVFGILTGGGGIVAGKGVDVVTTGASAVYDYNRVFGSTPNYITAGISVEFDDTFGDGVIMLWPQP
jgi:RHS repeat-associated protein